MSDIKMPDFQNMLEMADTIGNLTRQTQVLKVEIDVLEADTVKRASIDKSLSPDGKYLSTTFINSTFRVTGINNELTPKRRELARLNGELEKAHKLYDIMKMQFEAWRTDQANKRKVDY